MARPRKNDHLKQKLLETGMRLLIDNGYHGTGIKQILDAVNVPKGSFYNFFTSKEQFVSEIISYYSTVISEEFSVFLKTFNNESAIITFWLCFQEKVNASENCTCLIGAMASEIAQSSELCRCTIIDAEAAWLSTLTLLLNSAQQQGDVRNDLKAEDLALSFYNHWQGCLLEFQVSNNPEIVLHRLATFIRLLLTTQGHTKLASCSHYFKDNLNV
ncbi:TetR/AcrR family transcriptional regulator [Colwellia piezophila]|uniref:TetR/AcrR family transcriptional regulator n=1 Tax=Colwellia piezophila TaxID=211668 RepID=UPI000376AE41|nr:TetR/AcrR family transcriptional regulator [Colwellia piezophila]